MSGQAKFTSMQEALYHVQSAISFVQGELSQGRAYNEDAAAEIEAAMTTISEELGKALDAYTRLPVKRRPN
jgi:hypothetical protein